MAAMADLVAPEDSVALKQPLLDAGAYHHIMEHPSVANDIFVRYGSAEPGAGRLEVERPANSLQVTWTLDDARALLVTDPVLSRPFAAHGVLFQLALRPSHAAHRNGGLPVKWVDLELVARQASRSWHPDETVGVAGSVELPYTDSPDAVPQLLEFDSSVSRSSHGVIIDLGALKGLLSHVPGGSSNGTTGRGDSSSASGVLMVRLHLRRVSSHWQGVSRHVEAQLARAARAHAESAALADGFGVRAAFNEFHPSIVVEKGTGELVTAYKRGSVMPKNTLPLVPWLAVDNFACHMDGAIDKAAHKVGQVLRRVKEGRPLGKVLRGPDNEDLSFLLTRCSREEWWMEGRLKAMYLKDLGPALSRAAAAGAAAARQREAAAEAAAARRREEGARHREAAERTAGEAGLVDGPSAAVVAGGGPGRQVAPVRVQHASLLQASAAAAGGSLEPGGSSGDSSSGTTATDDKADGLAATNASGAWYSWQGMVAGGGLLLAVVAGSSSGLAAVYTTAIATSMLTFVSGAVALAAAARHTCVTAAASEGERATRAVKTRPPSPAGRPEPERQRKPKLRHNSQRAAAAASPRGLLTLPNPPRLAASGTQPEQQQQHHARSGDLLSLRGATPATAHTPTAARWHSDAASGSGSEDLDLPTGPRDQQARQQPAAIAAAVLSSVPRRRGKAPAADRALSRRQEAAARADQKSNRGPPLSQDDRDNGGDDVWGDEEEDDGRLCLVCMDGPRRHGFLHGATMHLGVCDGCAAAMVARGGLTCPMCRETVERTVAIFG